MKPLGSVALVGGLLLASSSLVGCGGDLTSPPPCSPTCPQPAPEVLYVAAYDQVLAFAADPTSGTLTLSAMVAGPSYSKGIAADPSGELLYVSDFEDTAVYAFSIAPTTGALTAVDGSPFAAGVPPGGGGVAIDPAGKVLFVTQEDSAAVTAFSMDPTTGALIPVPGSPFPTGATPDEAAVAPDGKFLYVSDYDDSQGAISAYAIGASGALTPVAGSPFATQASGGPSSLVVHPSGKFLYVGLAGTVNANHAIAAFSIDSASGALTPLPGSPLPTGLYPFHIVLDPAGKFLYAANTLDNTISAFGINAGTGVLAEVAGSPFTTASSLAGIVVDQSGTLLYAASAGEISAFRINSSTGALSNLISFQTDAGPQLLAIVQAQ